MKKVLSIVALGLAVSACEKTEVINATCGDYNVEILMSQDGEKLDAVINGDAMTLDIAMSASGARYVGNLNDTVVTLWNKGQDWSLFFNDGEAIVCEVK